MLLVCHDQVSEVGFQSTQREINVRRIFQQRLARKRTSYKDVSNEWDLTATPLILNLKSYEASL